MGLQNSISMLAGMGKKGKKAGANPHGRLNAKGITPVLSLLFKPKSRARLSPLDKTKKVS
jgi:hypothetical protein